MKDESTRQICEVSKDFDKVWWKLNDIDGFRWISAP